MKYNFWLIFLIHILERVIQPYKGYKNNILKDIYIYQRRFEIIHYYKIMVKVNEENYKYSKFNKQRKFIFQRVLFTEHLHNILCE